MASVNKVILLGHLGKDPETRYTGGGDAVTNFRIATSETWKDKSGEKQEKTEWHSIVCFGRTAEVAGEYLKKGSPVFIEGRLQTRKWEKDGVDRYSTEIIADRLQLIGKKPDGDNDEQRESTSAGSGTRGSRAAPPSKPAGKTDDFDDDIPF